MPNIIRVPDIIAPAPPMVNEAYDNFEAIKQKTQHLAENMFDLGKLFYDNKAKEYYKKLGYDTWTDFLGDPDIGYGESTVRGLMLVYRKFILEYNVPKERLLSAGFSKLRTISPVVHVDNVDELVNKATALSRSDLRLEVIELQTGEPQSHYTTSLKDGQEPPPALSLLKYFDYVKEQQCINCPEKKCDEAAHWPRTRARGQSEVEEWLIPMCFECHHEYHLDPFKFTWTYKVNIAKYLFSLILPQFKEDEIIKMPREWRKTTTKMTIGEVLFGKERHEAQVRRVEDKHEKL